MTTTERESHTNFALDWAEGNVLYCHQQIILAATKARPVGVGRFVYLNQTDHLIFFNRYG
jgi:hypothetical protein